MNYVNQLNEKKENKDIEEIIKIQNITELKNLINELQVDQLYDLWIKIEIQDIIELDQKIKKIFYNIFYLKRKDLLSI
jgi:DNA-binding Lrp family transcriptional regulator